MICVAGMVAKREEKTGHKGNRRPRKRITVKEGEAEHASSDTPVEVQRLGNRQSSQVVGARGVGWRRTETRVRRAVVVGSRSTAADGQHSERPRSG